MYRIALLGLALSVITLGCKSEGGKATVSGKVTKGGKAVTGGTLSFVLASDTTKRYSVQIKPADGSYTIELPEIGEYKVVVDTEPLKMQGSSSAPPKKDKIPEGAGPPAELTGKYVAIPNQFRDPAHTTLKATIKAGKQEHNVEIP